MKNSFNRTTFALILHLKEKAGDQDGYSLVIVLVSVLLLGALLLASALMGQLDSSSTRASTNRNSGFYAAEAGLNLRAQAVRAKFEGFNRPSGISPLSWEFCTDTVDSNNGSGDFACDTSLTINGQRIASYVIDRTPATPVSITVPNGIYAGLNAQEYRYDVVSTALQNEGSQQLPSAILGLRFKSRLVPLFQFAVFYENDIDFSIPPDMTMNGRIHSNNNIFVNSSSGSTLKLNSILSMGGKLYRGNKADAGWQQCSGTVKIPDAGGTDRTLNCSGNNITSYVATTTSPSTIADWGNKLNIGINPLTIPTINEFDPVAGAKYWDAADLRIVLKLDSSENPLGIEVRNANGSVNSSATSKLLNQCPVTERSLQSNLGANSTVLPLDSASGFNPGDAVTVGTDLDSNVIRPSGVGSNSIELRRLLGHSYQTTAPWVAGAKVRKAVVSTSDTFFNYREKHKIPGSGDGIVGQTIRMLNVDIQALLNCAHSQNLMGKALDDTSEGGLVWFFTVEGPNSGLNLTGSTSRVGNHYGVRLYNGRHLFSTVSGAPEIKGLTVVSDQAVYIRGDYNVDSDDASTSGITEAWKPAAVLADTINVLSNAWSLDDSNSRSYVGNLPVTIRNYNIRIPTETTMNVAFLAGTEISGGSNGISGSSPVTTSSGSGGVNNYPRFHEHWGASVGSGTTQICDAIYSTKPDRVCFNYRGSFVSLGEPRRVNSDFCGSYDSSDCNIYSPPVRNWDYDSRFNNAANLPPMTPRAVFLTQELFERNYSYTSFEGSSGLVGLSGKQLVGALFAAAPSMMPSYRF
ncbi:hypothetical protein [Lyngbya confervoides]|uniref:DUF4900 domain-containing protein n=1 Tax=Lyngbya confervoides BDU141951 TaxID=1574623 RepID=A0ABD4SXZ8_9CYAN|nr:hypothetical protein [Lyngbya confervoides]MCM1981288.1 hypothetical protein [Lyngbya confervoides BDU141951]